MCVYRKQEVFFNIFHKEFTNFIDKLLNKGDLLLVVGDFNVWMDFENDTDTVRLKTLMNACGLTQMVQEPTHREGHTLDHIYVNEHQLEIEHSVIAEILGLTTEDNKTKYQTFRKLKDVDLVKFREELEETFRELDTSNLDFKTM